jgi:hypothetical protein
MIHLEEKCEEDWRDSGMSKEGSGETRAAAIEDAANRAAVSNDNMAKVNLSTNEAQELLREQTRGT